MLAAATLTLGREQLAFLERVSFWKAGGGSRRETAQLVASSQLSLTLIVPAKFYLLWTPGDQVQGDQGEKGRTPLPASFPLFLVSFLDKVSCKPGWPQTQNATLRMPLHS